MTHTMCKMWFTSDLWKVQRWKQLQVQCDLRWASVVCSGFRDSKEKEGEGGDVCEQLTGVCNSLLTGNRGDLLGV